MSPHPRSRTLTPEQARKLGAKLRELRETAGLEVLAAARRCLLSDGYWYQLEAGGKLINQTTGERRPIQLHPGVLKLIADLLPVADKAQRAELYTLGGWPELAQREEQRAMREEQRVLPRAVELGSGEDYTIQELKQIAEHAMYLRFAKESKRSTRHGRPDPSAD